MARKSKVSGGTVLLHTILTLVTGGAWLLVLLVWFLISGTRK
jgi:hypothetical protein